MTWNLRDKVAIVGIGQTKFTRPGNSGRSKFELSLEAIQNAAQDAGVLTHDIDGFVTYMAEQTSPFALAQTLGVTQTKFMDRFAGGGESLAAIVHHAAMAIASGVAELIICY